MWYWRRKIAAVFLHRGHVGIDGKSARFCLGEEAISQRGQVVRRGELIRPFGLSAILLVQAQRDDGGSFGTRQLKSDSFDLPFAFRLGGQLQLLAFLFLGPITTDLQFAPRVIVGGHAATLLLDAVRAFLQQFVASLNKQINQSINQLNKRTNKQSIKQSINQAIIQSNNQSINRTINESIEQTNNQSINQSFGTFDKT